MAIFSISNSWETNGRNPCNLPTWTQNCVHDRIGTLDSGRALGDAAVLIACSIVFSPSGGFLQTQWSPRSANQCRGRYGMNLTKWQRWQCWQYWQHVWNMGIRQYRREVPGFLGFVALRQRLNSSVQARVRMHAVMFYYWQIPCTWRHVIFFPVFKTKISVCRGSSLPQ